MSVFLRLLQENDKASALAQVCERARAGDDEMRLFDVAAEAFDAVPGKPFAYWVSTAVHETFRRVPAAHKRDPKAQSLDMVDLTCLQSGRAFTSFLQP